MSHDVEIGAFLASVGFASKDLQTGRAALEAEGLTRPGKQRLSVEKLERAKRAIAAMFALHCTSVDCQASAAETGRITLTSNSRQTCTICGGSENARAADELVHSGLERVVIVGGTPATRQELERLVAGRIEVRLVDGTVHRDAARARADLEWAERVLLWGATELHHKVSKQYADVTATRHKVVHIPRRGIAQLLAAAVESVRRRAA